MEPLAFRVSFMEIEVITLDVHLPKLHPGQKEVCRVRTRFKAVRCGRRWGKTKYAVAAACEHAAMGKYVGWFAPEYKFIAEAYREISVILANVKRSSSRDKVFTTLSGGRVDFWSLENELAGRSMGYHLIVIDEAAFTKAGMLEIWQKNLRPTLLDFAGRAIVCSNTNGVDAENFFWRICNQPEHGFIEYHAPSHSNPYLPREELEKLERENVPLVYQQEYLAEFVDWSGVAFFALGKLLVDAKPVEVPAICDGVFAIVDSATKAGSENDGTGVVYFAVNRHGYGVPLTVLDWDVTQIEGALLETWLPSVFQNLEAMARQYKSRHGNLGVWIEDKSSGMVLIQQALRRNWPARGIDSKLTSVGKDERAISVSGYVYREMVKLARPAYDKVTMYKGVSKNHLVSQVVGFRIGDKEAAKRADDLLDCFVYGVALSLGNAEGF